jgi:hypothetical protein
MGRQVRPANSRQQADVLRGLYDAQAIVSALRLHGQRELLVVLVDVDIYLIDFNLRVAIPVVSAFLPGLFSLNADEHFQSHVFVSYCFSSVLCRAR